MEEHPINQSAYGRAWEDTKHSFHSLRFFLGVEVVAMVGLGYLATLFIPAGATKLVSASYPAIGVIIGVVIGFVIIYLVMLFRAPYKQRNESRKKIIGIEEKLRPNLAVFIEKPNPVPGGSPPAGQPQSYFWRLGVKNISMSSIPKCYSEIIKCYAIDKNGRPIIPEVTWPREGHGLPWGRGSGGTYEIDLGGEQTAYLDYIMIQNRKSEHLVIPSPPDLPTDRPNYDSYPIYCDNLELQIAVGSKQQTMKRSTIRFTFEWCGGNKAQITELENTSPQDFDKKGSQIE